MTFIEAWDKWFEENPPITYEEYKKDYFPFQKKLDKVKEKAIVFFKEHLDPDWKKGRLSYDQIDVIQKFLLNRFEYIPDDEIFKVSDYWDTRSLIELLLTGGVKGDCDNFGRPIEALFYYLCNYAKKDLYEVACEAETGEGHYVCWVRADDDLIYQVENRIYEPKTIRQMLDRGYKFWHYRPLTVHDKWFKPDKFIANELYKYTQVPNLEAEKPKFSWRKALRIDKSKTLLTNWLGMLGAIGAGIFNMIANGGNEIVTTLNANKEDIGYYIPEHTVGVIATAIFMLNIYLRTVTNKDVEDKKDYDH